MSILSELNKKTGRKDRNIAQAIANLNWDKQLARLGGYSTCRKVTDFLYECWYDRIDYSMAFEFFEKTADLTLGACSAVRNGDLIGRNFDWFYNNEAEFVIHTPAIGNHYASIGMATGADIQERDAAKFVTDEKYAILPFMLVDGVNSEKVFAEINVVPAEETPNVTVPDEEALVELNGLMLVRYILDNFATAQAAVEYIRDHATVYFPKKLHAMGYEVHVMVCDQDYSYILEFSENRNIIVEPTIPISTNFPLHDVEFNEDGTVYTPETQDEEHDAIKTNGIHKYGSGLERWNTIVNAYDSLSTEDGMMSLMWDTLRYSSAYPTSLLPADPTWYTEFVGGELTCASPAEDFADILEQAGEAFTNRSRDTGKTWHTAHSAIYNLAEGTLALIAQEDNTNVYDFAVVEKVEPQVGDVVDVVISYIDETVSTNIPVDEIVEYAIQNKVMHATVHTITEMPGLGTTQIDLIATNFTVVVSSDLSMYIIQVEAWTEMHSNNVEGQEALTHAVVGFVYQSSSEEWEIIKTAWSSPIIETTT